MECGKREDLIVRKAKKLWGDRNLSMAGEKLEESMCFFS
jgi:hypothetical protein